MSKEKCFKRDIQRKRFKLKLKHQNLHFSRSHTWPSSYLSTSLAFKQIRRCDAFGDGKNVIRVRPGVPGVNAVIDLPEHAIAQGGAQCGGAKMTDVPPVKTLFSESDADHHLVIVDVQ